MKREEFQAVVEEIVKDVEEVTIPHYINSMHVVYKRDFEYGMDRYDKVLYLKVSIGIGTNQMSEDVKKLVCSSAEPFLCPVGKMEEYKRRGIYRNAYSLLATTLTRAINKRLEYDRDFRMQCP